MPPRTARVERTTSESAVVVDLNLDGQGQSTIATGVGFYDHMLTAWSRHSLIDLTVQTEGDIDVDGHHTVEDTAITLGLALHQALGDKVGIHRFGLASVPLDEALATCVVDVAGRPYVVTQGEPAGYENVRIGGSGVPYAGSMTRHVVESLAMNAGLCVHLTVEAGRDPHHIAEVQYKALALALRQAVARDPRVSGVPSTKGTLSA
ncbi:MAG: imidazoleglycerol-phosphate dehydratase HisB [Propionibacteriaceae bacterium]|nr:imidazoleglycerol-phosphate dehydratase HisB [Propionibacteriaceae bacterium]